MLISIIYVFYYLHDICCKRLNILKRTNLNPNSKAIRTVLKLEAELEFLILLDNVNKFLKPSNQF